MRNSFSTIRRFAFAAVAVISAAVSHAGTFADITNQDTPQGQAWYAYTGKVEPQDVMKFRALLRGTDHVVLVVDSPGGSFHAGIELGRLTRLHCDRITIIAERAYSAAGLWALGDDDADFLGSDSKVGLHLPYAMNRALYEGEAQQLGYEFGSYMQEVLGYDAARKMMTVLSNLRDTYGSNAMLVFRQDGSVGVKR